MRPTNGGMMPMQPNISGVVPKHVKQAKASAIDPNAWIIGGVEECQEKAAQHSNRVRLLIDTGACTTALEQKFIHTPVHETNAAGTLGLRRLASHASSVRQSRRRPTPPPHRARQPGTGVKLFGVACKSARTCISEKLMQRQPRRVLEANASSTSASILPSMRCMALQVSLQEEAFPALQVSSRRSIWKSRSS
jgi:hypothetical protein